MEIIGVHSNICFSFHSPKFCNKSWVKVETVQVPKEIEDNYPQFITIPELYKVDTKATNLNTVREPLYFCNKLWNSTVSCCFRKSRENMKRIRNSR